MKLQQIKLAGFKSFVDPTVINIHGQLVGIVGPNGCGKSNVIDATRWVLGESSARQLRGENMTDVIFNGSLKRKAVSRASVELIFDNSAQTLSGLWNSYNEISIKRVLSRQGDSSYYINNQQVRRKDIAELFLGTGVGTKGYAVIEQGMITRIIESRPEEMRLFLEEAAGVSKYRERRKETLQRLNDTRENLQRLEDINSEIFKQLETLEEQAQVALVHQQLSQQLKDQQLLALAIKVRDADKILLETAQLIRHCEDELKVLGYQLEEVNSELNLHQEHKGALEIELQTQMELFNEQRTLLARVEERYKHYSDLLKRFESESSALIEREERVNQELIELDLQIENIEEQLANKQDELSELTIIREERLLKVEREQELYDEISSQVAREQDSLNLARHELDLLENTLKHKTQQKSTLTARLSRLEHEGQGIDFSENYHFLREEITLVEEDLLANEIIRQEREAELDQARSAETQLNNDNTELQRLYFASDSKLTTLRGLLSDRETDLTFKDDGEREELWQQLKVAAGYEGAIEAALNDILSCKLIADLAEVNDISSALQGVWLLNSEPAPAINHDSLSQYVTITDPRLSQLYSYLNNYQLLNNLDNRQQLSAGMIGVTASGHLATRDYVIYNAHSRSDNVLVYQQQLAEEELRHDQITGQMDELEQALAQAKDKVQRLNNDVTSLNTKHSRLVTKKHDLQLEFTKQEQIYVQSQRHQERIAEESRLLEQEIKHLQQEIGELEQTVEQKRNASEQLISNTQDIQLAKLDRETSLQLAKNKLQECDNHSNQLIIDNQLLLQQKKHAAELIDEKRLQLSAAKEKLNELSNERQSVNSNEQAQEIVTLQAKIAEVATQMQTIQKKLDDEATQIVRLKNSAATLNTNYQRNLERINQTRFREQEQNILLSTYQEQFGNLGISANDLSQLASDNTQSLLAVQNHCRELEQQIGELGLVNLKAIEDLAIAREHQRELMLQIEDLTTAIATLTQAIEQIDNETRKLLQTTFDALNQAIVVYFRTLFGGGNARLALTDGDILQAGMQIFAEPPGKKNTTIHLLSGGEKALAAMSFIFALFSLNPAPFCLLDEVDAPLDDANTGRFCKLVEELATKTQFVYISHNRLAMEMADQLVGVTMQEKGVSTVVTVNLVEAIRQVESNQNDE